MRVLGACSLGGHGHLLPLLAVTDVARDLGAEVLIVAPPDLAEVAHERGYAVAEGDAPEADELAQIRAVLTGPDRRQASIAGNRDLFGRLAAQAMLPAVAKAINTFKPDRILRETCEYASAAIAKRHNLDVMQVAIGQASIEWASIDIAEPALELLEQGLTAHVRHTPYLTGLPAALDPSPFGTTIRYRTTFPIDPEPLPPEWWPQNGEKRLCYVTFGSVLASTPVAEQSFKAVLEAISTLDCRVLLTTGRRFDPASLGKLPENVHAERFVSQDRLLPEASVVVCHGGSGTTFGTLAAARPLVIIPMLADNARNGDLVASRGAGIVVRRANGTSAGPLMQEDIATIRAAIEAVLTDPLYAERAQTIADDAASAPTLESVVASLLI